MDEESATTVALPFLLRGRWRIIAIGLNFACRVCGKVYRIEKD